MNSGPMDTIFFVILTKKPLLTLLVRFALLLGRFERLHKDGCMYMYKKNLAVPTSFFYYIDINLKE